MVGCLSIGRHVYTVGSGWEADAEGLTLRLTWA